MFQKKNDVLLVLLIFFLQNPVLYLLSGVMFLPSLSLSPCANFPKKKISKSVIETRLERVFFFSGLPDQQNVKERHKQALFQD